MSKKRKQQNKSKAKSVQKSTPIEPEKLMPEPTVAAVTLWENLYDADILAKESREEIIKFLEIELVKIEKNANPETNDEIKNSYFNLRNLNRDKIGNATDGELHQWCRSILGFIAFQKYGFSLTEFVSISKDSSEILSTFMSACYFLKAGQQSEKNYFVNAKTLFEELIQKDNVPRKIFLATLELKMTCHGYLGEYEEAFEVAKEFYQNIHTLEGQKAIIGSLLARMITDENPEIEANTHFGGDKPSFYDISKGLIIHLPESEFKIKQPEQNEHEVRWKKWTPKSDKIERRRCHNGEDSEGKIHEGVPRGSSETGNGGEVILTGGSPPVEFGDIHDNELGESLQSWQAW